MSIERSATGYRVRWRQDGRNRAQGGFRSRAAAEKFERRVKDLKAGGELHLLDAQPRGVITLHEYTYDVWWPDYAETNLGPETRANYAVQLDLRIIPKWGQHRLRDLRAGAIEAWVGALRRDGVGDPTILKTLTVLRAILARAARDEEIERNPVPLVAKPKQRRQRSPSPITPYSVELIRRQVLEPPERTDRRGRRIPPRGALARHMDATLVSVLAYSGPRPESEALPLTFGQVGAQAVTYRATKSGVPVERQTRLLAPLARDLAAWRLRSGPAGPDSLIFRSPRGDEWTGDDWDNWRERVFQPAAIAVGLPADTRPRDLRGSFASLLIFEGLNVLEVAQELGHSPATCLRDYAGVFREFDPARRRPAVDVIREAREAVASGAVPAGYPIAREVSG